MMIYLPVPRTRVRRPHFFTLRSNTRTRFCVRNRRRQGYRRGRISPPSHQVHRKASPISIVRYPRYASYTHTFLLANSLLSHIFTPAEISTMIGLNSRPRRCRICKFRALFRYPKPRYAKPRLRKVVGKGARRVEGRRRRRAYLRIPG